MKGINLYLKFFYQYIYKGCLAAAGICMLIFAAMIGIIAIVEKIEGATSSELTIHYPIDKFMMWFMFVGGIVAIVRLFEIGMRIRADRKSFTIALGIMAIVGPVIASIWQYLTDLIFRNVARLVLGSANVIVEFSLIGESNLGELICISIFMIMFGILIGCIYNRLGVRRFITFIIVSIALIVGGIWSMVYYNEELANQMMKWLTETPHISSSISLALGIIFFGISAYLLKDASFGNYTPNEGLVRIGKKSIGNVRIGKL